MSNKRQKTLKNDIPVQIDIPPMRVTLADLAFLKTLANGERVITCNVRRQTTDTCLFLGLVRKGDVQPDAKEIKAFEQKREGIRDNILAIVSEGRWTSFDRAARDLLNLSEPRTIRDQYILTPAGRELLKRGTVKAQTAKKGCIE